MLEGVVRRHDDDDDDDDDDELWCWRRNVTFDDDNGIAASNVRIRFQTLGGKLDEIIREAVDVIVIFGQWAADTSLVAADSNTASRG